MKRILLGLILLLAVLWLAQPAMAHGPHYGVRVYGGYGGYGPYRPYYPAPYPYYGPVYYPPPRVYYPPPYPVYPPPVVGGFYGGPGFGFYFGGR
jgi:hypothetical protein